MISIGFGRFKSLTISIERSIHLPRSQKATALAVDECADERDVVPLSPAVREANRRNKVVPRACPPLFWRACPWGSTGHNAGRLKDKEISTSEPDLLAQIMTIIIDFRGLNGKV